MSYGVLVQAEYEDGFVLTEDEADTSPYDAGRNIFHAIVNGCPCEEHGPMVRWAVITTGKTYSLDWKTITAELDNPRPIYYREMHSTWVPGQQDEPVAVCDAHWFGFQWNDADGRNMQEITEIAP